MPIPPPLPVSVDESDTSEPFTCPAPTGRIAPFDVVKDAVLKLDVTVSMLRSVDELMVTNELPLALRLEALLTVEDMKLPVEFNTTLPVVSTI